MKLLTGRFQYYVEGKCEKKLVRTLIDQRLIIPGQTDVLNPVQDNIKPTHLRMLPPKTNIILIFDTDTFDTDTSEVHILRKNIVCLKSCRNIRNIVFIPQIRNLEDELLRCTNIRHIRNLINCPHDSDFKTAFIEEKRLFDKLQSHNFDFRKLWSSEPTQSLQSIGIQNQSHLIKLYK